jgi:polyribonucleotide 5'-hydroxyl-kinase
MEHGGFDSLTDAVQKFKVNVILVIGNERILSDLNRKYSSNSGITVLKIAKSGGVICLLI